MGNSSSSSAPSLRRSSRPPPSKDDDPSLITPVGIREDGTFIYSEHDQRRIDEIVSQGRGYMSESGSVIIRGVRPPTVKEPPLQPTIRTTTTTHSNHMGENEDSNENDQQQRAAQTPPPNTPPAPSTTSTGSLAVVLLTICCVLVVLIVLAVTLLVVLLSNGANNESSNSVSPSEAPLRSTTTTATPTANLRSTTTPTTRTPSNIPSPSPSMAPSVTSAPTQPFEAVLFRVIDDAPHGAEVFPVSFHPFDSRFLVSGGCPVVGSAKFPTILVWDILSASGAPKVVANFTGHERPPGTACVLSAAFDAKGQFLGTGGRDNSTLLWNISHIFSPSPADENTGVVVDEEGINDVPQLQEEQPFLQLKGHSGWIWSVAWHPQNETLAATASRDGKVKLWDATSGEELASLDDHDDEVNSVSFHPNGTRLASGGDDNNVRIWNLETSPPENVAVLQLHTGWVSTVRYSPDGSLLASGSMDATVALWNATSGQHLDQTLLGASVGHTGAVYFVAWSPNGRHLASASMDATVRVWEVSEGKLRFLWVLDRHEGGVFSVAWSADGKYLASGSFDSKIRIWELMGGEQN